MAPSLIEMAAGTSAQDRTAGRPALVLPPPATAVAAPPRESPPARSPIAMIESPIVRVQELCLYY